MSKYIVKVGEKNLGPYDIEELKSLLKGKQIDLSNYVYSKDIKKWVMLGELTEVNSLRPKEPDDDNKKYFLAKGDKKKGPFKKQEIDLKIKSNEITIFDYIQNTESDEWCRIKSLNEFKDFVPSGPSESPEHILEDTTQDIEMELIKNEITGIDLKITKEESEQTTEHLVNRKFLMSGTGGRYEINNDPMWILKDLEAKGNLTYLQIVRYLNSGKIKSTHMIKREYERGWRPISDYHDFNTSIIIKTINQNGQKVEKVFADRKHDRAAFFSSTILKGKDISSPGVCTSISEGGCFVEMATHGLSIDDDVKLQILPGGFQKEIAVQARVVHLREKNPRGVGFEFLKVPHVDMQQIRSFVKKFMVKVTK